MLKLDDVAVGIGRVTIISQVSLVVPGGGLAGLIGRNGAGKTTLMRAIMGLIPLSGGTVALGETPLAPRMPAHKRVSLGVGYMPEDRRLVPEMTVEENILLPLWTMRQMNAERRIEKIYDWMPEVAAFRDRRALQLSGGQQKLVALARAFACGTRLVLLDEPFEGVAPVLAQRLVEIIDRLKGGGVSVLLSESDYTHSASLVDHVFVIERGRVEERPAEGNAA